MQRARTKTSQNVNHGGSWRNRLSGCRPVLFMHPSILSDVFLPHTAETQHGDWVTQVKAAGLVASSHWDISSEEPRNRRWSGSRLYRIHTGSIRIYSTLGESQPVVMPKSETFSCNVLNSVSLLSCPRMPTVPLYVFSLL